MYSAVEIHCDIHLHTQCLSDGRHTFHHSLHLVKSIDVVHFFSGIHLYSPIALFVFLQCLMTNIIRPVPADPAVDLQLVSASTAQHLIYRHLVILSLDVPQRLIDTRDGAHYHRPTPVEPGTVHGLPQILNLTGVFPQQIAGHLLHGSFNSVGMTLHHWFTPAADPFIRLDFQKQPSGLYRI